MKNLFTIILFTSFAFFIAATDNIIPDRPASVYPDAKWDKKFKIWEFDLKDSGFIHWYFNGVVKSKLYKSKNKYYYLTEDYYDNGNLKQKGQLIDDPNLRHEHAGEQVGLIAVGKWKEYYKNGNLKRVWCYTPKLDISFWMPEICGTEISYNEKRKEIKRIEHKLKCKYGCDELIE